MNDINNSSLVKDLVEEAHLALISGSTIDDFIMRKLRELLTVFLDMALMFLISKGASKEDWLVFLKGAFDEIKDYASTKYDEQKKAMEKQKKDKN